MQTLSQMIETLGLATLRIISAPRGLEATLSGRMVILDSSEEPEVGGGDIVFGIGPDPSELPRLAMALGEAGAAALVLREPRVDSRLVTAAGSTGLALLAVPLGVPWSDVILLVGSLISGNGFPAPGEQFDGVEADDLFAVANVIAEMVDAPITIEDPRSNVLAFSDRQEETDTARKTTILCRRMPSDWLHRMHQQGVYRRLVRERGPIYVTDPDGSILPRAAIAIMVGDKVLGVIWAVIKERLSPEQETALIHAADFAALHLLRQQLTADRCGLESELTAALLRGGDIAAEAVRRLNLEGTWFRVLAVADVQPQPGESDITVQQMRRLTSFHLSRCGRAAVTRTGHTVYAVVSSDGPPDIFLNKLHEAAHRIVERVRGVTGAQAIVAIGSAARRCEKIPASKIAADDVLRVLRRSGGEPPVAEPEELRAQLVLLRVTDFLRASPMTDPGPLQRLLAHDRRHGTAYVTTCRRYLDTFGDIHQAARDLRVHRNTVHYRLQQAQRIARLNLGDPAQRLALMIELYAADHD
jgi:hypothetical protein